VGTPAIESGVDHLLKIIDAIGCRVIMDHHAVREVRWLERFERLWSTARVVTAAAFLGQPEAPLESLRHRLWGRARKPTAKAESPRAIMPRRQRKFAKGGTFE